MRFTSSTIPTLRPRLSPSIHLFILYTQYGMSGVIMPVEDGEVSDVAFDFDG
jgi:hypothetical protein